MARKKFPTRQKKFPKGLEDFAPIFGKLTAPYVMFESKKLFYSNIAVFKTHTRSIDLILDPFTYVQREKGALWQ